VGVVGAHYGAATHLPVCQSLPEFDVVAVATAHEDTARSAAERWEVAKAHVGFEALCADPDVDLVCVATRPSLHRPMVEAALASGKHVLCEAPLAANSEDGAALVSAAERAGTLAVVDMQSRFSAGAWQLRDLVRDGWLGSVHNVHATAFYPTFTVPEKVRSSVWCADGRTGASSLRVHGLHTADLIRWIFGDFDRVRGTTATTNPQWTLDGAPLPATSTDSAAISGQLAGGALCTLHTSWTSWHGSGWKLEVYGSEGTLTATADGHTGHFPITVRGARHDAPELRVLNRDSCADDVPEITVDTPPHPLARLMRRVARSIANGTRDADLPTFADGLAALRLADQAE
jgi:predicted dehydrogenase